jgi:hypothetical protein
VHFAGTRSLQYVENRLFRRRVDGHDGREPLFVSVHTSNDARFLYMVPRRLSVKSLEESLVGFRIYTGLYAVPGSEDLG